MPTSCMIPTESVSIFLDTDEDVPVFSASSTVPGMAGRLGERFIQTFRLISETPLRVVREGEDPHEIWR